MVCKCMRFFFYLLLLQIYNLRFFQLSMQYEKKRIFFLYLTFYSLYPFPFCRFTWILLYHSPGFPDHPLSGRPVQDKPPPVTTHTITPHPLPPPAAPTSTTTFSTRWTTNTSISTSTSTTSRGRQPRRWRRRHSWTSSWTTCSAQQRSGLQQHPRRPPARTATATATCWAPATRRWPPPRGRTPTTTLRTRTGTRTACWSRGQRSATRSRVRERSRTTTPSRLTPGTPLTRAAWRSPGKVHLKASPPGRSPTWRGPSPPRPMSAPAR